MKIAISSDDGFIRSYNNYLPCVFIKPEAKIVKIVEEGIVEQYTYKSSELKEVYDVQLDIIEVHYNIIVGKKVENDD